MTASRSPEPQTGRPTKSEAESLPVARDDTREEPAQDSAPPRHTFTRGLDGHITHTDLASTDPAATKDWCSKVLGWTFMFSMPAAGGEAHIFKYSDIGGGGIHPINPPEVPGGVPYVHVASCADAFAKAVREGAEEMMAPTRVMDGVTLALVRAPGGVPIGLSGP